LFSATYLYDTLLILCVVPLPAFSAGNVIRRLTIEEYPNLQTTMNERFVRALMVQKIGSISYFHLPDFKT